jgi:acetyl esterase/lipase
MPAAEWLQRIGVVPFILKYRLSDFGDPAPLQDVLRAIRLIRSRADELGINPDQIGLLGFSAGGHLAACAAGRFDQPEGKTGSPLDRVDGRPTFVALIYPVVTLVGPFAHENSRRNLIGDSASAKRVDELSLDRATISNYCPTFIVHTLADTIVPAENSILLWQALRREHVQVELHIYEEAPHGFAFDPSFGPASGWPKRCEEWMARHKWLPGAN